MNYEEARTHTQRICELRKTEDYVVQVTIFDSSS